MTRGPFGISGIAGSSLSSDALQLFSWHTLTGRAAAALLDLLRVIMPQCLHAWLCLESCGRGCVSECSARGGPLDAPLALRRAVPPAVQHMS